MNKLNKVIKGLECCTNPQELVICDKNNCPYYYDKEDCMESLMCDALALLKVQEPMKPVYNEKKVW